MKYAIVYLIGGEAKKYQHRLIKKLADISGEEYLTKENPIPEHVTIRSPFKTKHIKQLEALLKDFAKKQKPVKIKVDGFGNFKRFVAFLKINFSREMSIIQKELIKTLEKEMRIKPHKFDKGHKPHATLAYGKRKNSFKIIWDYLKQLDKPRFDLRFNNITILKKPRKRWKIHKTFKIK